MKNINQDIESQNIKQFYLLFGAEDYLKGQYRDKLVTALVDVEDNMNYNYYEGKGINVQSVLDIGETMPFFADSRVIVIENSGLFKKCPEDFEKKLQALPESTHIIFVENEVDKRNRLYKWIGKAGYVSEMNTPDEKMLLGWVKGLCKKEEKQMDDSVIIYFVEHMGTDMLLLKNELEKLFSYCYGKSEITIEDVRQVCVSQAEDKLFDMLDAIGNHNQEKALLREPAMRVLYMFTRHFHILMQVNALSEEGKDNKTIASACGIPPFLVKKYAAQAGKYTYQQLRCMVEQCQDTDERIKTGRVQDTVGVELLIVEFSGK
jgi:DNA polymerase-3 subunit delta